MPATSLEPLGICTATLFPDPLGATSKDDVLRAIDASLAAGFTAASVWIPQVTLVQASGLEVTVIEAAGAWSTGTVEAARAEADYFAARAAAVGASKIVAVCMDRTWPGIDPAREKLALLVDAAAEAGAQVCVEFLPWSPVPDLATVWALVEPLGPSAGILLDSWHWQRQPGGPNAELLARIPGERIGYLQLSDAAPEPVGDVLEEAMSGRLLPGDGAVDFVGLVGQLDAIGATPVVMTEVFNPAMVDRMGLVEAATAMRRTGQSIVG